MPRINIKEVDNTLSTSTEQLYNVVYIPGFSINDEIDEDGLKVFKAFDPTLITSVAQFEKLVGKNAAVFGTDESYIDFTEDATYHTDNKMFAKGEADPSYLYAKTLVAAGIPVVYERVNESNKDTIVQKSNKSLSLIGFISGTDDPITSPPAPTDETDSVDKEYYIQIISATSGSESYTYKLFIYKGVENGVNKWDEITNKLSFDVSLNETEDGVEVDEDGLTIFAISSKVMYEYLKTRFKYSLDNPLYDRNATQIKYLTTGGYPVFEYNDNSVIKDMQALASPTADQLGNVTNRGDCIVLIDHTCNPERPLAGKRSVFYDLNTEYKDIANTWTAMFTPWFKYGGTNMPASFAYLISLANAINTNPNWLAIAGISRGVVPGATGLVTNYRMTRAIADSYMVNADDYSLFINPITNVRPYGLTIWGNRTLADTKADTEQALYYLNMRSLVCEIKKRCYAAAEQLMFEQNSDVLWINFKSKVIPLLDQMASSYGISGYKIIKQPSDSRIQLKALIKVFPIYAVEDFDITVMLTDDEVEVESN